MSEKVTAMIEEIKGLTVLELSELVHALEEEFGVSAAAIPLLALLLPLLRRRPSSTSSSPVSTLLPRSRSSRLSARSLVWAWPRPRLSSSPLRRL